MEHTARIRDHYRELWGREEELIRLDRGPVHELPSNFAVLLFSPSPRRRMWTYATMGMSTEEEISGTELHMFAQSRNDSIVELLNAVAHFHRTGASLNLGDTVNFGRPWWSGSQSDHALVSLPYLDGPLLEWLPIENRRIRFLWLLPITKEELAFKKSAGVEELERQFEKEQVNYLDPKRESVV